MKIFDGPGRGRPKKETTMTSLAIRLPKELIFQIDQYQLSLQQDLPGFNLARSDAIRQLIAVGLRLEKERMAK